MSADLWREIEALKARIGRLESADRPLVRSGAWAPSIGGEVSNPTGVTYSVQTGAYVLIETICVCWGRATISAITAPGVGAITIGGLPFTSTATTNILGGVIVAYASSLDYSAGIVQLVGYVEQAGARAVLVETQDNAAPDATGAARLAVGDDLVVTIIYPL